MQKKKKHNLIGTAIIKNTTNEQFLMRGGKIKGAKMMSGRSYRPIARCLLLILNYQDSC